ncbi:MAG: PAS domain S-box protein [Gemmataceae bacterium]
MACRSAPPCPAPHHGFQLVHPDDVARHRTRVTTALEECGSYLGQFRLIRPDNGQIIWLEERGHCINDETGKPVRLVGVVMDITERTKAEEELRQRAEEVQTLLDTLPIGIFVAHDSEGRTITGNKAAQALLRSPASRNLSLSASAEEKPTHFRVLRNAVELPPEQLPVQRAARGELVENEELEVVFANGSVINEIISAAPLFDPQGRVRGAVAGVLDITDRKRAEQQLHEERDRLRVTLASIGDAVIATDTEGRITFLNGVAETMTGWTNADAAGLLLEEVFRIVNEDTRLPVENPATRALRDGVIVGLANHTLLLRKDGTELPIDDSAAPVTDGQGQVVGCVLVFRDVTERRRAEAALRESEAHFRTMADNAPTMLWVTDSTGSCVYLSKSWHAYTGRTPEQDLGFGWLENIHPDDLPLTEETFRSANARRVPFSVDYRLRRQDGQYFWNVDAGQPRFDEHGHFQGFVGTVTDIHARRVAEAALRERTAQLDLTLSATGVGMWLNTLPLGDLNWDARTCELFFLPPGVKPTIELFWSRLHADDHEPTRKAVDAALKNGSVYAIDHRVVNPHTGEIRWMRSTGQATYNEDGVAVRFYGINYDITERKLLEEELRRVAAELSEANSKKDEFLATLAHELRNPLAPIRTGLQVMKLTGASAGAIEQARSMMERQLEQMVRLVDDLMDVSRITRGKVELRKERVQVAAAVNSALEACRPLLEQMNHDLIITMPPDPITVDADLTRLAQVFANLLNNAAKYTDRGGRIHLTVERQANDVVVSVRDTGIGIPSDKLISIFDMFSQVDRSLEKAQGGLGIGLTLVRRLVEMHGGTVEARSDGPGHGAEFVVRLPTIEETVAAASDPPDDPAARKSSLRILVVDDNRDGADSLSMMLRILGNETHTAYDGQEGVEKAERVRPHVILFDIGLPRLNGYEACRHIRRQVWGKSIVLLALTGWGQDEDRRRSQEAGFDHHLVKPVDPEMLLTLLAELPLP